MVEVELINLMCYTIDVGAFNIINCEIKAE